MDSSGGRPLSPVASLLGQPGCWPPVSRAAVYAAAFSKDTVLLRVHWFGFTVRYASSGRAEEGTVSSGVRGKEPWTRRGRIDRKDPVGTSKEGKGEMEGKK